MDSKHTPEKRCNKCRWIHETDSVAGTSYMGVGLCTLHAAAPDLLAALKELRRSSSSMRDLVSGCATSQPLPVGKTVANLYVIDEALLAANAAIAKAEGR